MCAGQVSLGPRIVLRCHPVQANADLDSLVPRFAVEARQAMQEHLTTLFVEPPEPEEPPPAAAELERISGVPSPVPVACSSGQQEELAQENATRHDWIAEEGRQQREVHGKYQRTADLRISTTDPGATPMRRKCGGT